MSIAEPSKILTPWASTGSKNPIPANANNATGAAGFDKGFPDITMTPEEAGGLPPAGQDFNGIFYQITDIIRYMQAGGQPFFSATLSSAIGGYPKGCIIAGSDSVTLWQNIVNGNVNNPDVDPSGWSKWAGLTPIDYILNGFVVDRGGRISNRDEVSILDYGAIPNDAGAHAANTIAIQMAMDFAALSGKPLISDGQSYWANGLVAKSGLTWNGANTVIKLAPSSNVPVIRNQNTIFAPSATIDHDIEILGVIFDGNGLNQSNEIPGGGPVVGAMFHGVKRLTLGTEVRNSRRYAYWLINCETVRGSAVSNWTSAYIAGGGSPNRDSMHINGNVFDVHFSTLKTINGGDDSLALNADDVNHGGVWTQSAVSGPIVGVTVDHLYIKNSHNGIRVLSANYEVGDVLIGNVVGDVTYYSFVAEAYGLGTSSLYRNVKVNNLSLTYKDSDDAGRPSTAFVKIDTTDHNPAYVSDFEFGTIDRASQGSDEVSVQRQTLWALLTRCNVRVGSIIERDCSNERSTLLQGAPLSGGMSDRFSSLEVGKHVRLNSSNSAGGNMGTSLYAVQCKGIRRIYVGDISPDVLKAGVVLDGCEVDTLDVWHTDHSTSDAISVASGSIVKNMVSRGIPSTMFFNAPYVVDGSSSVLRIGVTNDTGPFIDVSSFSNGWTNLGVPYANVGYRITSAGMVELQGVLNSGTINLEAFVLPSGYRPAHQKAMSCATGSPNSAILKIKPSGEVVPADNTSGFIALDGVTFRAEQ